MNRKTIIFAGPSAVGKTYIADELVRKHPGVFEQAKLYTTRAKRSAETASDRVFVSDTAFDEMIKNDQFIVYETFSGGRYGFTKQSLFPTTKHLLVNAWPWLIEQFSRYDHAIIIAMQAPHNWEKPFTQRMKERGDTTETIKRRLGLIEKDKSDLESNKKFLRTTDFYFTVIDNSTIPKLIIPEIETSLNL